MTRRFGKPAYHYASLDSTMRAAAHRARSGCPEGTVVTADLQTAGRGRHGRTWHSEEGQGLYLSLVLRPDCTPDKAPLLTLVAGLGAKDALERTAGVQCDIRWPNDILIRERKCCGILVEMEASKGTVDHVVVGIGVNLNHLKFPAELRETATSLRIETGTCWTRDSILGPLLDSLQSCYELLVTSGPAPIVEAFQQSSSYALGRRVIIEGLPVEATVPTRGVTAGLSSAGLLLLRSEDGSVAPVLAGSVRPDKGTM